MKKDTTKKNTTTMTKKAAAEAAQAVENTAVLRYIGEVNDAPYRVRHTARLRSCSAEIVTLYDGTRLLRSYRTIIGAVPPTASVTTFCAMFTATLRRAHST